MKNLAPTIAAFFFALPFASAADELPLVFEDNFEKGADHWQPSDAKAWKLKEVAGAKEGEMNHVFSQHAKKSDFNPPHRSPFNISLLKDVTVTDFEYTAKVLETHEDYDHRDAVLVFGYQDPTHFYYVHFGKKADDHANQIFIVNDAPRTKISLTSTTGTPWDEKWHTVRVRRDINSGSIEVFFDDLEKPAMTAKDKTFTWGRIGLGTFDDTADFDDVVLKGKKKD
jgi:hypothetical protein